MYRGSCIISLAVLTLFLLNNTAEGQTPGFVQQDIIKRQAVYTDADIPLLGIADRQVIRSYYDGLGQALQTIAVKSSPAGNDIIQPYAFNALGQQTISYLPYVATGSSGVYRPNALTTEQSAFYSNGLADKVADDSNPYSQVFYSDDPSQRLLLAGKVGNGYQVGQHSKNINYRSNNSGDGNIIVWSAAGANTGNYAATKLSVTEATDEDQKKVATFNDATGRLILKREYTETAGKYQDTYYIYNSAGQVSYVVPPKALDLMVTAGNYSLAQAGVNKLIFQYWYDNQGRVNQKLIPTKGLVNIIYDPLNRPVLVQDAQMATSYKWYYTKYDAKDHPVSSGVYTDPNHYSASAMQTAVNGNTTYNTYWYETRNSIALTGYYSNNTFPSSGITPLTYVYFDNYDMDMSGSDDYSYTSPGGLTGENAQTTATLRGVPTMTRKTTVGNGITAGTWLVCYTFYDSNGRPIQTKSNNQLTTTVSDSKTNVYDFAGSPTQTKVAKVVAGNTTSVITTIGYDPTRRVNSIDQSYNGGTAIRIASYVYNELGQLVEKNLGLINSGIIPQTLDLKATYSGTNAFVASQSITLSENFSVPAGSTFSASIQTNYLQSVDYRYNIRGNLISINNSKLSADNGTGYTNDDSNDLFGMQFLYDNADANIGNTAYYNGNLSAIKWMSKDGSGTSSVERSYKYTYDAANRYKGESYAERATASTGAFGSNVGGFDENVGLYDFNGNIQTLTRKSSTPGGSSVSTIDNLTYTYDVANPNQLKSVVDASGNSAGFVGGAGSYTYDAVGNLTADPYKVLGITYNDLNKTNVITVSSGTNRHLDYTYDASGALIRKQQYDNGVLGTTTDYIDGFVYIGNSLSYFPMPEGRVRNTGSSLKPEYIITDQQGNARISFEESATAGVPVVRQENSYYGTGMSMTSTTILPTSPNKTLYNGGSEWQNDYSNSPDYYQTLNRNYDAALGRFVAADPMAEETESMTVYQYANNNPIMMNDPDGDYAQSLYYSFMSNPGASVASPFSDPYFNAKMTTAFRLRGTDNMWNMDGGGNWLTNDVNGSGGGGSGPGSSCGSGCTLVYQAGANNNLMSTEELTYLLLKKNVGIDFITGKLTYYAPGGYSLDYARKGAGTVWVPYTINLNNAAQGNNQGQGGTPWVNFARSQLGVKEATGHNDGPDVDKYLATAGLSGTGLPWCGCFVNWSMKSAGITGRPKNPALALNWRDFGQKLNRPAFGSVGSRERKGGGHVGLIVATDADRPGWVVMLGGNQGDAVSYESFPISILKFNYPSGFVPSYTLPSMTGIPRGVRMQ
ncbi:TIGR02594 family protein [Mucilaginibacter rubeus]|nr:TIGR02594 family protein [Mucilaginibacter rubeus]